MAKTTAQKCLESDDAFAAATEAQTYSGSPSPFVKRVHFEDGSYIDFKVSYEPVAVGRAFED